MHEPKHTDSGAAKTVRPPVGALVSRLSTNGSPANASVTTAAVRRMDGGALTLLLGMEGKATSVGNIAATERGERNEELWHRPPFRS